MRISTALSCYDAQARLANGYPLSARGVSAVEALPQRYPQPAARGPQLPVERIVEGEVLRERPVDPAEHLRAQRFFTLHVGAPATPHGGAGEREHSAVAAYRQNSGDFEAASAGRYIDQFI